jgi:PAS domain S-box-containing protein
VIQEPSLSAPARTRGGTQRRWLERARYLVPAGRSLPDEAWRQRHRGILVLLWLHAITLPGFGIALGVEFWHSVAEGGVIAASALLAGWRWPRRQVRAVVASLGLITSSAILVHLSGGYIEMHFHFFVMVTVIALYQDWIPFLAAIGYVAGHHAIVGTIAPAAVYNHPSAIAHPWQWAFIHAGFVLAAAVASIANWRVHEIARARAALILDSAGEGICGLDHRGSIDFINSAALRMIGAEGVLLIGQPFHEAFGLARADGTPYAHWHECPIARPLEDRGVHESSADIFRRQNGSSLAVEYVSTPIEREGRIAGVVVAFKDITERRLAEAVVAERVRLGTLGIEVGVALSQGETLAKMLHECMEAFVRQLDMVVAGIWIVREGKNVLDLAASAGSHALVVPNSLIPVGQLAIERITRERAPWFSNAFAPDPEVETQESTWIQRTGVTAFAGHPLIVGNRVVGVLGLFSRHPVTQGGIEAMASVTVGIAQAIERKRAEEALQQSEGQLRQAQKMEAIGRLAGGVAHDINNMLTVVIGQTHFVLQRLAIDHPLRRQLEEAAKAANRAAALPRQLLAFSRKQVLQPVVMNLNELVKNVTGMLRMMIGEDVELKVVFEPGLGLVKVDPGQLEQVIMNLAVNARDAMPHGGHLTIETTNVDLDDAYARLHADVLPGPHVMLAVSDTGSGINAQVRSHLFEPFFTTKEKGKGTGLGLSTVYGIVKQSGAHIWVYSEPGQGATFKLYFPRVAEVLSPADPAPSAWPEPGRETILLVEDESQVRDLASTILREHGYDVLEASDGVDACRVSEAHHGHIHLLLTDVIMPQMSGDQLAEQLKATRPEMRVLFMSGYTDSAIEHHGVLDAKHVLLQKPFTEDTLVRKLRTVLDRPA